MPNNLPEILKPALMNNSFDYDSMEAAIKRAYYNSYYYLYKRQVAEVNYNEFFYYTNDIDSRKRHESGRFYLNKSLKAVFEIDYDIIGNVNREEYRRSKFYQKEFTFMDMVYNPQIFSQLPIVIIDNRLIYDLHISVSEEYTRFRLPFGRSFVLKNPRNPINDHIIYKDHRVQVITIDNTYYQRFLYNKATLLYDDTRKTITLAKSKLIDDATAHITLDTNKYYMKKYRVQDVSEFSENQKAVVKTELDRRLRNLKFPDTSEGIFFLSLHFLNDKDKDYELGTSLIEVLDNGDGSFTCNLPNNIASKLKNHNYSVYVSLTFFRGLHKHIFYDGSDINKSANNMFKMMVIEDEHGEPTKSPVPPENMMVFKRTPDRDEFYLEKNTESVKVMNTNIYWVFNDSDVDENSGIQNGVKNGLEYKVYYFYYDIPNLKYNQLLRNYNRLIRFVYPNQKLEEIVSKVNMNILESSGRLTPDGMNPDFNGDYRTMVQNTQPYTIEDYNEFSYIKNTEQLGGMDNYPPFDFKRSTLHGWMKKDPDILRDYVLDQKKITSSYYLFTNTLDLTTRLRRNTATELGAGSLFTFEEDRYVFAFNNSRDYPVSLDARVFVDGLLVGDVYQERKNFLEYFYIPASMVTNDSFIEIELFPRYRYTVPVKFTALTDKKNITLPKTEEVVFPTAKDIILTEPTPDGEIHYDLNLLDMVTHYDRGDIVYAPSTDANAYGNDGWDNVPYRFTRIGSITVNTNDSSMLNKNLNFSVKKIPTMSRFTTDVAGYGFIEIASNDFQLNTEYIRIFRNGRLVSRNRYRLITSYGYPKILIHHWLEVGDIVYIDITPYRYNLKHRRDEIDISRPEIAIPFTHESAWSPNKPFDIRYYDVYLNGRKLSINNVFNLSPYEITLANIKSKYDLEIYEKERDQEYFAVTTDMVTGLLNFSDYYHGGIITDDDMKKIVHDYIEEQKDPRLHIYPNTYDEPRFDQGEIDLFYAIYFLFYYDELIPKKYYNPDLKQSSSKLMMENFIEVYNKFKTLPYADSDNDEEKARRRSYPDILYLDPDDWVDSNEGPKRNTPDGKVLTWVIGHSEEPTQEMLNTYLTIPDLSNLI